MDLSKLFYNPVRVYKFAFPQHTFLLATDMKERFLSWLNFVLELNAFPEQRRWSLGQDSILQIYMIMFYVLTQNTLSQHDMWITRTSGFTNQSEIYQGYFQPQVQLQVFLQLWTVDLWSLRISNELGAETTVLAESKESLSGTRNVLNTRSEKLKEGRGADSARWSA